MKQFFVRLGIRSGLILLAIVFSLVAVGSLIASAHSVQSTTTATANPMNSPACQQYLQGMAQRLNMSVTTLEQQVQETQGNSLFQSPCN